MTTVLHRLPLRQKLTGLRLLAQQRGADAAAAPRVAWLLSLQEQQQRRAAEAQALQGLAQAVQRALQGAQAELQVRLDQLAGTVVELGLALAREIVGQAAGSGLVDPTPVVLHCLRDCVHGPDRTDLRIHLHPDDLGMVLDRLARMPDVAAALAAADLLPDPALARGAVRAETGAGRLRYDLQETFERVAAAVRSVAAGGTA